MRTTTINSAAVAPCLSRAPHRATGAGGGQVASDGRCPDRNALRTPARVVDTERRGGTSIGRAAMVPVGRATRTSSAVVPASSSSVTDAGDSCRILRTTAPIAATARSSLRPNSDLARERSDHNTDHDRRGLLATASAPTAPAEQNAPVPADGTRSSARGGVHGLPAVVAISNRAASAPARDNGVVPLPRTPAAVQIIGGQAPGGGGGPMADEVRLKRVSRWPPQLQAKPTVRNFSAQTPTTTTAPSSAHEVLDAASARTLLLLLAPERSSSAAGGPPSWPDATKAALPRPSTPNGRPSLLAGVRRPPRADSDAALLLTPHEPPASVARYPGTTAAACSPHAANLVVAGGVGTKTREEATKERKGGAAAPTPSSSKSSTTGSSLKTLPALVTVACKPETAMPSLSSETGKGLKAAQHIVSGTAAASSPGASSTGLTSNFSQLQQRAQGGSTICNEQTAVVLMPRVVRRETSAAHYIIESKVALDQHLNRGNPAAAAAAAATAPNIVEDADTNTSSSAQAPAVPTSTLPPPPSEPTAATVREEVVVAEYTSLSAAALSASFSSSAIDKQPRCFSFGKGSRRSSQASSASERANGMSARRRRVGFKEKIEVVLPDSKSLRGPGTAWLEFRNPTMREQGKELMPSTEEVFSHLSTRTNAVCSLVVVDEDAVRSPCLVVSGLSVRVFQEDKAVTLANKGVMNALTSRGGLRHPRGVGSSEDDADDDEDGDDEVGFGGGVRLGNGTPSRQRRQSGGGAPSNLKACVQLPDKKDDPSRQGDSDDDLGELDRYLHKFDVDETLSRAAGRTGCPSVALELLMQTWVTGHNTCMLLGNGNGRGTHAIDLAISAVQNALCMLSERLRDSASRVEVVVTFADVADDEERGGVRVKDLLATPPDSDAEDDDEAESQPERRSWTSGLAAAQRQRRAALGLPPITDDSYDVEDMSGGRTVQLGRSPLLGIFAKGLREVRIEDAIANSAEIGQTLTEGFLQYSVSAYSSRSNSMSNLSNLSSLALRRAHTSFATIQLKTICRGLDMRNTRLSARESATMTGKMSKLESRQCRSFEYDADVLVSSLLLVFFGSECTVLDTLVQRSGAHRMMAGEVGEDFALTTMRPRTQRPEFRPCGWPNAVGFLQSLLYDALGGRTRTMSCLCLSDYDTRAALWLRTVCQTRRLMNVTPNCGNVRNYLKYLLEQHDKLLSKQRRRKSTLEIFYPAGTSQPPVEFRARAKRSSAVSRNPLGEWSTVCLETMIESLDNFLTTPTGSTPALEQLAIATEEIAAAAQAAPPARLLPPRRLFKK